MWFNVPGIKKIAKIIKKIKISGVILIAAGLTPYDVNRGSRTIFPSYYQVGKKFLYIKICFIETVVGSSIKVFINIVLITIEADLAFGICPETITVRICHW